jgi:hypothetical protein
MKLSPKLRAVGSLSLNYFLLDMDGSTIISPIIVNKVSWFTLSFLDT